MTTTGRRAEVTRTTKETDITVTVDLDGTGAAQVVTGIGFYDHLLESFAYHALLDVTVEASGDVERDDHHTVEDVALALGEALSLALGDRAGIQRFGEASVPMDEAHARALLDLSGRPYAELDLRFRGERVGGLSTQMIPHLLESLVRTSGMTLHLKARGRNDHHVAEAAFKALARAVRAAVTIDPRRSGVASTKGTLT